MSPDGKFARPKPATRPALNSFGLDNRMTVVLFAGMGGGCDGLEDAGYHVHPSAHGFDPNSFDHLITVTDAKGRQNVRKQTAQHNVEPELMVAAE